MSELGESPRGKTVRLSKIARIKDFNKAGDMFKINRELDTFPYNTTRPELTNEQMRKLFPRLAKLFTSELERRNSGQDTDEFEAVKAA